MKRRKVVAPRRFVLALTLVTKGSVPFLTAGEKKAEREGAHRRNPCPSLAEEGGSWKQCTLAVTCKRKSRKQLTKAEWECAFLTEEKKRKSVPCWLGKEEAENSAFWQWLARGRVGNSWQRQSRSVLFWQKKRKECLCPVGWWRRELKTVQCGCVGRSGETAHCLVLNTGACSEIRDEACRFVVQFRFTSKENFFNFFNVDSWPNSHRKAKAKKQPGHELWCKTCKYYPNFKKVHHFQNEKGGVR